MLNEDVRKMCTVDEMFELMQKLKNDGYGNKIVYTILKCEISDKFNLNKDSKLNYNIQVYVDTDNKYKMEVNNE